MTRNSASLYRRIYWKKFLVQTIKRGKEIHLLFLKYQWQYWKHLYNFDNWQLLFSLRIFFTVLRSRNIVLITNDVAAFILKRLECLISFQFTYKGRTYKALWCVQKKLSVVYQRQLSDMSRIIFFKMASSCLLYESVKYGIYWGMQVISYCLSICIQWRGCW